MRNKLLAGAAVVAVLATPAYAQSTSAAPPRVAAFHPAMELAA